MEGAGERYEVIDSQRELEAVFNALHAGRIPKPDPPKIDFTRSLVLFVRMAPQPTAGYEVELGKPALRKETLVVPVHFHTPPEEALKATVLTRPFILMKVEGAANVGAVEFINLEGGLEARVSVD